MRKFPLFVWLAVFLIAELALQYFSLPGIFLMFLGAPFWSVILVNGILLSMGWDALKGTIPRWAIAVPVLVYAAYFVSFGMSRIEYGELSAQVNRANAGQSVPFDPRKQDLYVDYSQGPTERGDDIAYQMLANFKLPSMYQFDYRNKAETLLSKLIETHRCEFYRSHYSGPQDVNVAWFQTHRVFIMNACIGTLEQASLKPRVVLTPMADEIIEKSLLKAVLHPMMIETPNGTKARVAAGSASLLQPIPMPVIGCVLIDNPSSWKCFAQLVRTSLPLGYDAASGEDGRVMLAGRALGLPLRQAINAKGSPVQFGDVQGEIDPSEIP